MYQYYLSLLGDIPSFLDKYLECDSLCRLKNVGYFCGMDYASKDIYDFSEYISRYDHSITTALLTYKYTKKKDATIAALFHDVATPCFSHVIDYMNKDYEKQESTEEYTERIIYNDKILLKNLDIDGLKPEDIINFKKYSIVDNERPKMCADRIDGVILTAIGWTKNITKSDICLILDDLVVYQNEDGESELGFKTEEVARRVKQISASIDFICHSNEDNYMMELLANITRIAIEKKYISYDQLYTLTENELFKILKGKKGLIKLLKKFYTIKKEDIDDISIPNIKIRNLYPLVGNKRIK